MISHEIRTPLTNIMISSDLLKAFDSQWDYDMKLKHFARISDTVLKMTKLMENVMTIGRIETGKLDYTPEWIDLPAFCESVIEAAIFNTNDRVKVNLVIEGESKDAKLDESLLWLTLFNILTNSIKFSRAGTIVDFIVECQQSHIIFTINDRGIGIPDQEQENLFSSFFRASNVGTISGYGLGLAIVKNCIEAQSGTIQFESQIDKGTKFIVTIPV
jgi:signal transduction histidine kinase